MSEERLYFAHTHVMGDVFCHAASTLTPTECGPEERWQLQGAGIVMRNIVAGQVSAGWVRVVLNKMEVPSRLVLRAALERDSMHKGEGWDNDWRRSLQVLGVAAAAEKGMFN